MVQFPRMCFIFNAPSNNDGGIIIIIKDKNVSLTFRHSTLLLHLSDKPLQEKIKKKQ